MKLWKSMLTMLLCSGLIIAFGLTACGDDDDEESGMTCEQALEVFGNIPAIAPLPLVFFQRSPNITTGPNDAPKTNCNNPRCIDDK